MTRTNEVLAYIVLAAVGILGPVFFENYIQQIAVLWIMVLMASTWDITGGQMGYNSLGNITFFGAGMYISAVVQISMGYDVAEYTAAFGAIKVDFTDTQYFTGIALGIIAGGIGAFLIAILFGMCSSTFSALSSRSYPTFSLNGFTAHNSYSPSMPFVMMKTKLKRWGSKQGFTRLSHGRSLLFSWV